MMALTSGEHPKALWQSARVHGAPMAVRRPVDDPEREAMLDWAMRRIPHLRRFDVNKAYPLEVRRAGQRLAVAVFHEWRDQSVELSMIAESPRWASKGTITAILSWPFTVLRVRRITTITPESNVRAIKLNEGLGFEREGLMRCVFGDEAAVIMGLTREDWMAGRWCRSEGAS